MKLIVKLVMLVVVAVVVLVLARNVVVKAAVEHGAKIVTGMPLNIGKLDINLTKTFVGIEALVIKNPTGFHDTVLVDIPKILIDYQLFDILKGNIHLQSIEFDMKQFTVVKNGKGELNLNRLKALQGTQKAPAQTAGKKPGAPAKAIPIRIDMMRLKIGKVVYVDYSGGSPSTKEFLINLDQSYQNITDLNGVVRLIVLKAMMSSGISNLVNFDINGLQGSVTDALNASAQIAAQAAAKSLNALKTAGANPSGIAGQTGNVLKSTAGTVENVAEEVAGGVKNVASSLKNKLKLPF